MRAGALLAVGLAGAACTHASAKLVVDSPKLLVYQPPDIDDITGIDSSEDAEDGAGPGSGSAQNQHK